MPVDYASSINVSPSSPLFQPSGWQVGKQPLSLPPTGPGITLDELIRQATQMNQMGGAAAATGPTSAVKLASTGNLPTGNVGGGATGQTTGATAAGGPTGANDPLLQALQATGLAAKLGGGLLNQAGQPPATSTQGPNMSVAGLQAAQDLNPAFKDLNQQQWDWLRGAFGDPTQAEIEGPHALNTQDISNVKGLQADYSQPSVASRVAGGAGAGLSVAGGAYGLYTGIRDAANARSEQERNAAIANSIGSAASVGTGAASLAGVGGDVAPVVGAAIQGGTGVYNAATAKGLSDTERAILAGSEVGNAAAGYFTGGILPIAETAISAAGGPSWQSLLVKAMDALGLNEHSKSWMKFPGKIAASGPLFDQQLGSLAAQAVNAGSLPELTSDVARYKTDVGTAQQFQAPGGPPIVDTGGYGGVGNYGVGSDPYTLPGLPATYGRQHGVNIPPPPQGLDPATILPQVQQLINMRRAMLSAQPMAAGGGPGMPGGGIGASMSDQLPFGASVGF